MKTKKTYVFLSLSRKYLAYISTLFLLLICACSPPQLPRILWPAPPNQPRLEFIGTFASQNDFQKTAIERFNANILGTPHPERFRIPQDAASDGKGRVFIVDSTLKNVRIYNFNTKKIKLLTPRSPFRYPSGVEFGNDNLLYVADPHSSSIFVMDPDTGAVVKIIGKNQELKNPVRTAINNRLGRIYVSDPGQNQVIVFDMDGNLLFRVGNEKPGVGPGYFNNNQGVAVADDDNLYVADMFNARVQVFDKDGKYLFNFGERGDRPWQFSMPRDLAFDSLGNLYIVDSSRAALVVYDKKGVYLSTIGAESRSRSPVGFSVPTGIGIDVNDRIIIVDAMLKRFVVWQYLTESYLDEHPITESDMKRLKGGMITR